MCLVIIRIIIILEVLYPFSRFNCVMFNSAILVTIPSSYIVDLKEREIFIREWIGDVGTENGNSFEMNVVSKVMLSNVST